MLIEDEESHRALLKAQLRRPGLRFLQASSARRGLRLAEERRPDLILLDILMPPRNAWYVLEELKGSPDTKDIPVIVVSVVDDEAKVRAMGAEGYVRKPFRVETLRKQVQEYIGGYGGEEGSPG